MTVVIFISFFRWRPKISDQCWSFGTHRCSKLDRHCRKRWRYKCARGKQNIKNSFWKAVLYDLSLAKPVIKLCKQNIFSLDILNFVSVPNFTLCLKWKENNVIFIKDIVDFQSKSFLNFLQFREKTNTNNFLLYHSLIQNIPENLRKYVKDNCNDINIDNFIPNDEFLDKILAAKKIKFVYSDLIRQTFVCPIQTFV